MLISVREAVIGGSHLYIAMQIQDLFISTTITEKYIHSFTYMGLIRFTTGLSIGPTHPIDMVNRLLSYMYISPDRNMYCSTSNDFGNVEHRLYFNLLKTSCNGRRIITTISDAQARYLVSRILSNVY